MNKNKLNNTQCNPHQRKTYLIISFLIIILLIFNPMVTLLPLILSKSKNVIAHLSVNTAYNNKFRNIEQKLSSTALP